MSSERLIGSGKRGKLFVISAPGGTGKTTLARLLTAEFSGVVESISFTSREKREGEKEGIDYYFVTKEQFAKKVERGDFLEYAVVYDDYYGTDKKAVEKLLEEGKHVLLVIDTQGARVVKEHSHAISIFIFPPSLKELKKRLEKRGRDSSKDIEKRLEWAEREIALGKSFDYQLTNDDLDVAYQVLRSIIIAEDHKKE